MLKVGGLDQYNQLILPANQIGPAKNAIISPPQDTQIIVSSLRSFSIYCYHSVWVTNDGKAHAIGNNYGQMWKTLPLGQLKKPVEYEIVNGNSTFRLQSAVCENSIPAQLVYIRKGQNGGNPFFITPTDSYPIKIYGGRRTVACINEDGSVVVISPNIFDDIHVIPYNNYLPNNEKAIDIACCDEFIFVLSDSGHIYKSAITSQIESICDFVLVSELKDIKIVQVSGTYNHCLAVSDEGLVYGTGSNYNGQLGVSKKEMKDFSKFVIIESLENYKIVSCCAGFSHSLFITDDGKLFACGLNTYGQLLLKTPTNRNHEIPELTMIDSKCAFAIAGDSLSCCFIDCIPPLFSPNLPVTNKVVAEISELEKNKISTEKVLDNDEVERKEELITEIDQLQKKNESLKVAGMKIKQQLTQIQSENHEKKQKLDSTIKNLKSQKQELISELSLMNTERKDLSEDITNLNLNLEDSLGKLNLARSQKDEILNEIKLLSQKRDQINFDNELLIKERTKLVKEMEDVQKESDQLNVEYETVKLKNHNLSEVVASLEQSKSKLKKRVHKLKDKKDSMKSQIATLESEYDNLLNEYEKSRTNQNELTNEIEELRKEKIELVESVKENEELKKEFEISIPILRKEHNELSKGIKDMKLQYDELMNDIKKMKKEKEDLQKTNSPKLSKMNNQNSKENIKNSGQSKIRSKTFEGID